MPTFARDATVAGYTERHDLFARHKGPPHEIRVLGVDQDAGVQVPSGMENMARLQIQAGQNFVNTAQSAAGSAPGTVTSTR